MAAPQLADVEAALRGPVAEWRPKLEEALEHALKLVDGFKVQGREARKARRARGDKIEEVLEIFDALHEMPVRLAAAFLSVPSLSPPPPLFLPLTGLLMLLLLQAYAGRPLPSATVPELVRFVVQLGGIAPGSATLAELDSASAFGEAVSSALLQPADRGPSPAAAPKEDASGGAARGERPPSAALTSPCGRLVAHVRSHRPTNQPTPRHRGGAVCVGGGEGCSCCRRTL